MRGEDKGKRCFWVSNAVLLLLLGTSSSSTHIGKEEEFA